MKMEKSEFLKAVRSAAGSYGKHLPALRMDKVSSDTMWEFAENLAREQNILVGDKAKEGNPVVRAIGVFEGYDGRGEETLSKLIVAEEAWEYYSKHAGRFVRALNDDGSPP